MIEGYVDKRRLDAGLTGGTIVGPNESMPYPAKWVAVVVVPRDELTEAYQCPLCERIYNEPTLCEHGPKKSMVFSRAYAELIWIVKP